MDHGVARKRLALLAAVAGADPAMRRVSRLFNLLQDSRNDADYERPRILFSRGQTQVLIGAAREAVDLLAALDEDARRRLAVELLVARSR